MFNPTLIIDARGSTDDALEFLALWKNQAEAIWSYDIELAARIDLYDKISGKMMVQSQYRIRQRFMQGNWRFDILEKEEHYLDRPVEKWVATSDDLISFAKYGQEIRFFNAKNQFGQIFTPRTFNPAIVPTRQIFECYRSERHGEMLPDLLLDRKSRIESNNEEDILLFFGKTSARHNHSNLEFRVSLSKSSRLLPSRIVYGSDLSKANSTKKDLFWIEIENKLEAVKPGLIFPVETIERKYSPNLRGSAKEPISIEKLSVDISSAKFNIDIHPKVFQVPFPPGTIVYETETEQNYLQEEGDKADYENASQAILERMGKINFEEIEKSKQAWSLKWILIFNFILLIVAISVTLFWRRKRR